jgi:hypothetical protein
MPSRRLDAGLIIALAWLFTAGGLTVLLGPSLGMRGWVWVGLHLLLCLIGCTHELRRAWLRREADGGRPRP